MARRVSRIVAPGTSASMPLRRRRRRRATRRMLIWAGAVLGAVTLVPTLVVLVLLATIDPNAYRAQIEAAVRQALGRELRINGAMSITSSLSPKLIANDVVLANIPSGTRPDMVRVERAEVELAPRALLTGRFVIARIVLLRPDILLETTASGEDNWRFDNPPPRPAAPAKPGAAAVPSKVSAPRLTLQTVHIRDGRVTWRDDRTGRALVFDIPRISATASSADSPVAIGADVAIGRQHVTLSAQTGPLDRLVTASAEAPWGLFASLESGDAKLSVTGTLTRPLEGSGYALRLDGAIPDLATLAWLSPVQLPPLHNLNFSARVIDQGGPIPDISSVTLQVGLTILDSISPGFTLDTARFEMARLSEPVVVSVEGNFASQPLRLDGTIGPIGVLLPGARGGGNFAIDLNAGAAGAALAARGTISQPTAMKGMDIALGARVPDLGALSALAGRRLPPLKTVAISGHLTDGGDDGYASAIRFKGMALTVPQGDVSGDVTLRYGGARPAVQAVLKSGKLDASALAGFFSPSAMAESGHLMGPSAAALPPLDVTRPVRVPRRSSTVIPDTPLPLDWLRRMDADLQLTADEIDQGSIVYRNVAAHGLLQDGKLSLQPLSADLPGGRVELALGIDAAQSLPPASLVVHARDVDVKPVLAAWGLPDAVSGTLQAEADLHAAGATLHRLAASVDGRLGLGLSDGDFDNAQFGNAVSELLRVAQLGNGEAPTEGRTGLRCAVVRLDASHGVATLASAVLDSGRLLLDASGQANLDDETLAMQLRPMLRTGGPGVVVPMRLTGSLPEPKLAVETGNAVRGALAGLLSKGGGTLGAVARAALPGEHGAEACAPALAAVRAMAPSH